MISKHTFPFSVHAPAPPSAHAPAPALKTPLRPAAATRAPSGLASALEAPSALAFAVALALAFVAGCQAVGETAPEALEMRWAAIDSLNARLPAGVRVFSGRNDRLPLRAWYVEVATPAVRVEAVVSDEPDRREAATSLARDHEACIVVNGGYFRMDLDPSQHVSLLVTPDSTVERALSGILRPDGRYPTTRAAIGIDSTGSPQVKWVATLGGQTLAWDAPWPNSPGKPAEIPAPESGVPWAVTSAIAGGPQLLRDGRIEITVDEEVFFDTSVTKLHPRTAAGVTADGSLILMVVDGRQPFSRGATLEELAGLMASAGARDALNLDGGGSSTLVVNGLLVNLPSGVRVEREIMSALAVFCDP